MLFLCRFYNLWQEEECAIMPGTVFSEKEKEYLGSQHLARIAAASSTNALLSQIAPVGFDSCTLVE
jgi:hypothetical protein